jgi:uncharacterized membrane protein YecN with MAPEG domain
MFVRCAVDRLVIDVVDGRTSVRIWFVRVGFGFVGHAFSAVGNHTEYSILQ